MQFQLARRFPYQGWQNWALVCSLAFITSQLLWTLARYVQRFDFIELPCTVFYFPPAFFIDPHDGMLRERGLFLYALSYWLVLFYSAFLISRQRINPAIPAAIILVGTSAAGIVYAVFFVFRGPIGCT